MLPDEPQIRIISRNPRIVPLSLNAPALLTGNEPLLVGDGNTGEISGNRLLQSALQQLRSSAIPEFRVPSSNRKSSPPKKLSPRPNQSRPAENAKTMRTILPNNSNWLAPLIEDGESL